jgi:hypothetical protein
MVGAGAESAISHCICLDEVKSMATEGPRLVITTAREGRLPAFKFMRGASEVNALLSAFRSHNIVTPENDSFTLV